MKASLAESYRSIPLFADPHDEPLKLSDEYLSICRKFDEARIICGYPVPTPAGSPIEPPSFGPDWELWEQRAREHCRSIDVLLAANAQRQKRIDALEASLKVGRAWTEEYLQDCIEKDMPVEADRVKTALAEMNAILGDGNPESEFRDDLDPRSAALSSAMRGDRPLDPYGR